MNQIESMELLQSNHFVGIRIVFLPDICYYYFNNKDIFLHKHLYMRILDREGL
ncbi:hypothetical protein [Peribacillus asahii]|uniref:hypothetical protein n=1 Tax=Peribacillus asahii TaxID=228899 RepID=UPI00207A45BB|nr:hypothetical protein [Peribacillus asahii]USK62355.1 hypothetical protein LIT37_22930 [Peribacillus asahii]